MSAASLLWPTFLLSLPTDQLQLFGPVAVEWTQEPGGSGGDDGALCSLEDHLWVDFDNGPGNNAGNILQLPIGPETFFSDDIAQPIAVKVIGVEALAD